MNEKIYSKFIEAENDGELKIIEIYNKYFDEYKNDYKKMAELLKVINNRLDNEDDKYLIIYLDISSRITSWSNENLDKYELEDFCKIADDYCNIQISEK